MARSPSKRTAGAKPRSKTASTSGGARRGKTAPARRGKAAGGANRGRPRRAAPPRRRLWRRLVLWGGIAAIWLLVAVVGMIAWYAYDLPSVDQAARLEPTKSVTVLAADGSEIFVYGQAYGEIVRVEELPPHLVQAVLAVEDRRFYEHPGVDPWGLLRALVANLRAWDVVQGGSTLTQQLAKNLFLTPERSLRRKIQEAMLAFWLESRFSKDQILNLYLNRVYLGAGATGVDAGARRFFGKSAREVDLYESAVLAGLLKAPSRLNPRQDPDRADNRAGVVLAAMVEADFVTAAEAEAAFREKTVWSEGAGPQVRYFADWVLSRVETLTGRPARELLVTTTLDPKLQAIAERETVAVLEEAAARQAGQAAVVVLAPDGAVKAMVGGRDYGQSQFNRATQALRQPGSAFKPFVYLSALEAGWRPDDPVIDEPVSVGRWRPENYRDKYYGQVTLREAFARSLNSVSVRLSEGTGRRRVVETAHRLGIDSDLQASPSIALGASEVTLLELTGAYATFAREGRAVEPHAVLEVRDRSGAILYRYEPGAPERLVEPAALAGITDLMVASVSWGTGKKADPGRPAGGKTGTSQGSRDAWFLGFTADLVAGVWFGNDDGHSMDGVTGGQYPAELWGRIVRAASEELPVRPLPGQEIRVAARPARQEAPTTPKPAPAKEESSQSFVARLLERLTGESAGPDPNREERLKELEQRPLQREK